MLLLHYYYYCCCYNYYYYYYYTTTKCYLILAVLYYYKYYSTILQDLCILLDIRKDVVIKNCNEPLLKHSCAFFIFKTSANPGRLTTNNNQLHTHALTKDPNLSNVNNNNIHYQSKLAFSDFVNCKSEST